MATCINIKLSPSYCYKHFKCRCERCLLWKKEAASRTNDKIKQAERARIWRLKNPERSIQNVRDYQKRKPEVALKSKLKKYGLSVEQYMKLLEIQDNTCAICDQTCSYKFRLSVDHCHTTGKVRGLLCGNCNTGLGKFKDNDIILTKAINYLRNNREPEKV